MSYHAGGGNAQLERIPSYGITKEEYDRYVEATGRPFTDPWVEPHRASRAKAGAEVAARNKKEAVGSNV